MSTPKTPPKAAKPQTKVPDTTDAQWAAGLAHPTGLVTGYKAPLDPHSPFLKGPIAPPPALAKPDRPMSAGTLSKDPAVAAKAFADKKVAAAVAAAVAKDAPQQSSGPSPSIAKAATIDPADIEKTLKALREGTLYEDNPLLSVDNANYHFRLFMTTDRDIIEGGDSPSTVADYYERLSKFNQVTIAETGVTGYNIQSVQMEALVGPNHRSETTNATSISMTVFEPGGMSFLDSLKSAALKLRVRNYNKCWYYLELSFKGYEPRTGAIMTNALANSDLENGGRWIWQVQITDIQAKMMPEGGQYTLSLIPYFETALDETIRSLPEMIACEGNTVGDMFDDFKEQLNASWVKRTVNTKGLVFDFKFHGASGRDNLTADEIRAIKITTDEDQNNAVHGRQMIDSEAGDQNGVERDPRFVKPRAYVPQGTSIPQFVQMIFSSTEFGQQMAFDSYEGKKGDPDDADDKVNDKGFREPVVFRVEPEVHVTGFDPMFNTYQRNVTYHIYAYLTQRPILSRLQVATAQNETTQRAMVDAMVRPGLMKKCYNYLYTGMNLEVIDLDLSFNMAWSAQLPMLMRDEAARTHLKFDADKVDEATDILLDYQAKVQRDSEARVKLEDLNEKRAASINNPEESGPTDEEILKQIGEVETASSQLVEAAKKISETRRALYAKMPKFDPAELKKGEIDYSELLTGAKLPDMEDMNLTMIYASNEIKNALNGGMNAQSHQGKSLYGAILNQLHGDITSQFITISLKIKGDPYWIGPANMEQVVRLYHNEKRTKPENTADYTLGDNAFLLNFKYPVSGEKIEYRQHETVTAIYGVTKVIHEFNGGSFTQTIEAYRHPLIDVFKASVVPRQSTETTGDQ